MSSSMAKHLLSLARLFPAGSLGNVKEMIIKVKYPDSEDESMVKHRSPLEGEIG